MYNYMFIAKLIPWELIEVIENDLPIKMKTHLPPIIERLKAFSENKTDLSKKWVNNSLILVEACLDKTWETLNSGYWKDVPIEYRYCYSLCTILKAVLLELQQHDIDAKETTNKGILLKDIVQQIDKGILLGSPLPNMPYLLPTIASHLNNHTDSEVLEASTLKDLISGSESLLEFVLPGFTNIIQYNEPSMELFYKEIFKPKVPALLKGCIKHWKALEEWQNINYLSKIVGNRTVPIEIGSRYTDEDWSQQLVTFSEFLQKHVLTKHEKVGYLAQHQLFEQIPELKYDFTIPEYCNFSENEEVEQPDINAWFGPSGTVSPLHFDPKNNLLCQVFGYKRVILYHPKDSPNLYPYDTRLLNNTAQVDPLNPNYEKWPNLIKAKGFVSYLKPGEILYIPPKWWHHVTSLTPSFSISFWWN
ncbi:PREDICTED: lysine-specific demethylase 8-like [Dufourea novaeangliae]|uniref:lysine-specific demethylase 8-like n=1 Tax=Dufourea novaeangliae TaxID=178035 RepID=UPI0007672498|nr:PREDICTED: lysine-specific demethylase 8-like [Dufourea novaeangliae]